jgi:hypothetical protein
MRACNQIERRDSGAMRRFVAECTPDEIRQTGPYSTGLIVSMPSTIPQKTQDLTGMRPSCA